MKTFRCSAEMQFLGDRHEITKMTKFNVGHEIRPFLEKRCHANNTQYVLIPINKILDISMP